MKSRTSQGLISKQYRSPIRFAGVGITIICLTVFADHGAAHPGHEDAPPSTKRPAETPPPGESEVTIEIRQGYRYIEANGLPDHDTGRFPSPGNPNAIEAQSYKLRIPITPKLADEPVPYERQPFGIALNGVLFDPYTAGFWNDDPDSGWRQAADPNRRNLGLDANHGHVQPNGAYHYHGVPVPLVIEEDRMTLIGWAADGFPIYGPYGYKDADSSEGEVVLLESSYQLKEGERPEDAPPGQYDGTYDEDFEFIKGSGDLDELNGRSGPTPEFPMGTYYYVVSHDYPFVPRFFRGVPDPSFDIRGHNGPRNGVRNGQRDGVQDDQRERPGGGSQDDERERPRRNRRVRPGTDAP